MSKPVILSNIAQTGTMFEIVAPTKDITFGVGTKGVISYVEGYDKEFKNVVYYKVIVMRRGKGGKKRIELEQISMPIFVPKCSNLKHILPETSRKHFVFVDMNKQVKSVLEFDNHLFLAWAYAYGKYLYKLHLMVNKIKIWPGDRNHVLNTINNFQKKFINDQATTLSSYTSNEFRRSVIKEIRLFEINLSKCVIDYLYKLTKLEEAAIFTIIASHKKTKINDVSSYEQFLDFIVTERMNTFKKILKIRKKEATKFQTFS